MDRYVFTIIVAIAISPTLISPTPFFWRTTTTTTTTTAATTVSLNSSSDSTTDSNSTSLNFNNGNSYSVPLSVSQTGSTVDGAMVTTIDQFVGDLNITVPTGRRSTRSVKTFTSNTTNYTSDIQNCINQYPFDYETLLNNAVSSVINCISAGGTSRSIYDEIVIRNLIEQFIDYEIINNKQSKTLFNGLQTNIFQCGLEASDIIAQQALETAQNINNCIANGTSTTTTTTASSA